MIVSLVFLEYMLDAIRVIDQVSGPEKEAYPNDITVVPGHFQSKTQRVVPDISRTPKQEMIGRPWLKQYLGVVEDSPELHHFGLHCRELFDRLWQSIIKSGQNRIT